MQRPPAVAGRFYRGTAEALKQQVQGFLESITNKIAALGILSPHAGLVYSGAVAGAVYSRLVLPDIFVLIGPNHTGLGAPVSIMTEGSWETPLGSVEIETGLAQSILSKSPRIREDILAHLHEHSLEVQLPFIQGLKTNCKIVPIQMLDTRLETCLELGRAVAAAIAECQMSGAQGKIENPGSKPLIVASSDMSHYESAAVAKQKDFLAIERILDLDPEGLYRTIKENGITMCGFGPAVAMLTASKILGATGADLVKYASSGDITGDYDQVVGYAGMIIR